MTPSEIYGMLRWANEMREEVDAAIRSFEFRIKALQEKKP